MVEYVTQIKSEIKINVYVSVQRHLRWKRLYLESDYM